MADPVPHLRPHQMSNPQENAPMDELIIDPEFEVDAAPATTDADEVADHGENQED